MRTTHGNIHLEIQTSRKNPVGILRSSYYQDGSTKHTQHGRITGCTLEQLKLLQLAFRQKVVAFDDPEAFNIIQSKEYGASKSILSLIKKLGLDKIIYSRSEPWVKGILAMITGRIIYAGSKLSLCNEYENSSLWQQCGTEGRPDVEKHCYLPLDKLLARQNIIQQALAKKHLQDGHLVLYDITSSYMEGAYEDSELVKFGYNRDGKSKHEQVVIGLLCNKDGCPVGVELYPGNTKDETTVVKKIKEIKHRYGVKDIIFVGDRGMLTRSNVSSLKEEEDLRMITALSRLEVKKLLEREVIQLSLFDERNMHEVIDPDNPKKRYCLCRNPDSASRDKETRERLLTLTAEGMEKIAKYKKKTSVEVLGARVGKLLAKYNMGKLINWEVKAAKEHLSNEHQVIWNINNNKHAEERSLDGCYIITTDVAKEDMDTRDVVASYKKLALVETAFRNLKTVQLEVRPMYHKKDERIKAHVFLCVLAYYVQWHMQQALKPLFFKNANGKNREWTFANVIHSLKQITINQVTANGIIVEKISQLTKSQAQIADLLGVKI